MASTASSPDVSPHLSTSAYSAVPILTALDSSGSASLEYDDKHIGGARDKGAKRPGAWGSEGWVLRCLLTPVLGLAFIALGGYAHFSPNVLIVGRIEHAAFVKAIFGAALSTWAFFALFPAFSAVMDVRAEEWWRELTRGDGDRGVPFSSINTVSSGRGGSLAHIGHIVRNRGASLPLFLSVIAAIAAVALNQLMPGAIVLNEQLILQPDAVNVSMLASLPWPSNKVFTGLPSYVYHSRAVASISWDTATLLGVSVNPLMSFNGVPENFTRNVIIPPATSSSRIGSTYTTDYANVSFACEWKAPTISDPPFSTPVANFSDAVTVSVDNYTALGRSPLISTLGNTLTHYTYLDGTPAFDGTIIFLYYNGVTTENLTIDISTVPSTTISQAWHTYLAPANRSTDGWASETQIAQSAIASICRPTYSLGRSTFQLTNGIAYWVADAPYSASSPTALNKTAMNLALTDALIQIRSTPYFLNAPLPSNYWSLYFNASYDASTLSWSAIPRTAEGTAGIELTLAELYVPAMMAAYFVGAPFGETVDPSGTGIVDALVVAASVPQLLACIILFVTLVLALCFLYRRQVVTRLSPRIIYRLRRRHRRPAAAVVSAPLLDQDRITEIVKNAREWRQNDGMRVEADVTAYITAYKAYLRRANGPDCLELVGESGGVDEYRLPGRTPASMGHTASNLRKAVSWLIPLALGSALVAFGILAWVTPISLGSHSLEHQSLYTGLFTFVMGIWRTATLLFVYRFTREVMSEEWTRIVQRTRRGRRPARRLLDEISSNRISLFRAVSAFFTSAVTHMWRFAYVVGWIALICGILAQNVINLVVAPVVTSTTPMSISASMVNTASLARSWPGDQDFTASDDTLAIFQPTVDVGANFVYFEYGFNTTVGLSTRADSIVPINTLNTQDTETIRYVSDVAHINMTCDWRKATLQEPPADISSDWQPILNVSTPAGVVSGLSSPPQGLATITSLHDMSVNGAPLNTGAFVWLVWGGNQPSAPIQMTFSSEATPLSQAWLTSQQTIFAPAFINQFSPLPSMLTYPDSVVALFCDPQISIDSRRVTLPKNGAKPLLSSTAEARAGNIDPYELNFWLNFIGSRMAVHTTHLFQLNMFVGLTNGLAIFDPARASQSLATQVPYANASIIASTLSGYLSTSIKPILRYEAALPTKFSVTAEILEDQLVLGTSVPQLLVTAVLLVILCIACFIMSRRDAAGVMPMTVAALLIKYDELEKHFDPRLRAEEEVKDEEEGEMEEVKPVETGPRSVASSYHTTQDRAIHYPSYPSA